MHTYSPLLHSRLCSTEPSLRKRDATHTSPTTSQLEVCACRPAMSRPPRRAVRNHHCLEKPSRVHPQQLLYGRSAQWTRVLAVLKPTTAFVAQAHVHRIAVHEPPFAFAVLAQHAQVRTLFLTPAIAVQGVPHVAPHAAAPRVHDLLGCCQSTGHLLTQYTPFTWAVPPRGRRSFPAPKEGAGSCWYRR